MGVFTNHGAIKSLNLHRKDAIEAILVNGFFREQVMRIDALMREANSEGAPIQTADSKVSVSTNAAIYQGAVLTLDFGGTKTKVVYSPDPSSANIGVDSIDESDFDYTKVLSEGELKLFTYARALFEDLAKKGIDGIKATERLVVVWSNDFSSELLSGEVDGVTGIIDTAQIVGGYNKNEGYVADIKAMLESTNPDDKKRIDIGQIILEAAKSAGFTNINTILVINDVTGTHQNKTSADGAIVSSTGANGVVIIDGKVHNGELGAHILIGNEQFTRYERTVWPGPSVPLEKLCARGGWKESFDANLDYIRQVMPPSIYDQIIRLDISDNIKFCNAVLEKYLSESATDHAGEQASGSFCFKSRNGDEISIQLATINLLGPFVQTQIEKAGLYAGLLAYASIANQRFYGRQDVEVLVDSSMAGLLPGYLKAAEEYLNKALSYKMARGRLIHLRPEDGGTISVPAIGAVYAARNWMD